MNVTELARKLKLNTSELLEVLPGFGFDIGKKAIKVDDRLARRILKMGVQIKDKIEAIKRLKMAEAKKITETAKVEVEKKEIKIPALITVRDLAKIIGKPVNEVIKELMKNGVMASLNERIDFETATIIADELGVKVSLLSGEEALPKEELGEERVRKILKKEKKSQLKVRAPVVVVMGHVDHGKTKLLDTIRKTNVMATEAGGITQHIGAYQVKKQGKLITFIDTPGHEAFTAMRSRGAKVADIAILVVAANDSVKPQTIEAIKIIQQAKLPMIVAINKIDLPDADIEKVKKDLSALNLLPEDWGGKTICQPISARENIGIDDLLGTVLLLAEMEKDKIVANPESKAVGTVIESHLDKGEGPVATVLIQNGTLELGDNLCSNDIFFGKARALKDFNNLDVKKAEPSMPVKIIGFKYPPKVGDILEAVCKIERKHKKIKGHQITREEIIAGKILKAEEKTGEEVKKLNLIIKADVLGSLEVITESLEKIETKEVRANVISKGLGNITDADINRAAGSQALILGFRVKATSTAEVLAREKNVEIKYYDVIYRLFDEVKERLSALIPVEVIKKTVGKIEVLAIFKTEAKYTIFGGRVLQGKVSQGLKADVLRKNEIVASGEIAELRLGKEKITELTEGQECGINFRGKGEIKVSDFLEVYQEEAIKKKIT